MYVDIGSETEASQTTGIILFKFTRNLYDKLCRLMRSNFKNI